MSRALVRGLMLMLVLTGVACRGPAPFRGLEYPDPVAIEGFSLVDHRGREFRLGQHHGNLVLLFFGYVHCPDVCPMTLSTWARVEQGLGPLAERVRFAFVTVDPERDSADRLQRHVAAFSPRFVGLTGSETQLGALYRHFGIFHEKAPFSSGEEAYVVDHSTRMYMLDLDGRLRLTYGFETSAANIVHDAKLLLTEAR